VPVDAPAADVLDAPETRRYLDETVRVWLGLPHDAEPPQLPSHLARLLLRLEEHESGRRDRWGCWDFEFSENVQRLGQADVDRWLAERRDELSGDVALEPLWPDHRPLAVCMTHDVDLVSNETTPRQIVRHARAGAARIGAETDSRVARLARPAVRVARSLRHVARAPSMRDTLERSVELELQRGIRASYFFTVPARDVHTRWDCVYAPDDPCCFRGTRRTVAEVMRTLADEGFDVGLHGSYPAGEQPGALEAERAYLEAATGLEIATTRQHFLHWDVRWTPRLQQSAGFRADSSLGFNRNVGYRAGSSLPFRQFDVATGQRLDVLEVPLVVQDGALLGEIGTGVDLEGARAAVRELFEEAAATGGAVTAVFHPDKLDRPDWLGLYEWTLDHALERGAWIASLREVEAWWQRREQAILGRAGG
jgi:hypothetical protein